jgi:hypothetical protein
MNMRTSMTSSIVNDLIAVALVAVPVVSTAYAAEPERAVIVNVDNFVRAETAAQFDRTLKATGGVINRFSHLREPTPVDRQLVIPMNRTPSTARPSSTSAKAPRSRSPTPGAGTYPSWWSTRTICRRGLHEPGRHQLTVREFGTPYAQLTVRTLVNASDPADVRKANALQDQLKIEAVSAKPYTHPAYDEASYKETYDALLVLGRGMKDTHATLGRKEGVDPVRHLLGAAWGWGGLPETEAYYLNAEPKLPVGAYQLTVKDAPADAFWSVSVYNKDGFFEPNAENAYSVNSLVATPNEDGSFTIHFGGDPKSANHLPITDGWNYTMRLYKPRRVSARRHLDASRRRADGIEVSPDPAVRIRILPFARASCCCLSGAIALSRWTATARPYRWPGSFPIDEPAPSRRRRTREASESR